MRQKNSEQFSSLKISKENLQSDGGRLTKNDALVHIRADALAPKLPDCQ
jgi:hypothetical protein